LQRWWQAVAGGAGQEGVEALLVRVDVVGKDLLSLAQATQHSGRLVQVGAAQQLREELLGERGVLQRKEGRRKSGKQEGPRKDSGKPQEGRQDSGRKAGRKAGLR
jgi:hypothetical protein